MLKRTITAVWAMAIFIPICYFSDTIVFPIAMAIASLIGAYEMTGCVGVRKSLAVSVPTCLISAAVPIIPWFTQGNTITYMLSCYLVYLIILFTAIVFAKGKLDYTLVASAFMGVLYTSLSFTCIVMLREAGAYLYLLVFIGPWVSDIFAYLCGRLFGKHKLIPEVSPKKTVEGSIGGIVFSAIAFIVYGMIIQRFFASDVSFNIITMAIVGAVISIIAQIGDLAASAIKRRFDVKDYGNLFPGHGGVLDRFDSVLLTAPVLYLMATIPYVAERII
ncbi:MAG: phosphatidate cytidylyltransferase [Ruminococcaceae bacterium]|nr:phosphatidate cytidylyltransferase [Oscillospiraceae bacterium]